MKQLLSRFDRWDPTNAAELILFHELLLFLRVHPQDSEILKKTEQLLSSFGERVARLRDSALISRRSLIRRFQGSPAHRSQQSGATRLPGMAVHYPAQVEIDGDGYEGEAQLIAPSNTAPCPVLVMHSDQRDWVSGAVQSRAYARARGLWFLAGIQNLSELEAKQARVCARILALTEWDTQLTILSERFIWARAPKVGLD